MKPKINRRTRLLIPIFLIIIAMGFFLFVQKSRTKMPEHTMNAMYLTYGDGLSLFVDTGSGALFDATIPADALYDTTGKSITKDKLVRGNILKIHGNGIMLESYPGQYPGVTKMEMVSKGQPSDAIQYDSMLAEIYQEPDPSQPPFLNIEYKQPEAHVTVMITNGGYQWTYVKADGTPESRVTDAAHVLTWTEINDMRLFGPTNLKLIFSVIPQNVTVLRWPESMRKESLDNSDIPAGEPVLVTNTDDTFSIPQAEAGYIYFVTAKWENGQADFGFLTN